MHNMTASEPHTPVCGVERGVQVVCIAFGDIYADLDRLT